MMADLGLDTLQKRRDLARLSMMYRIVHNLVDIPVGPYLTPSNSMTRGHDSRFHQIRTTNNTYQQSFFPRTTVLWNQLPQDNAVGLLEPAGNPHLLNATPCFYLILTTVHTSFIRGAWASSTTLRENSSTEGGNY